MNSKLDWVRNYRGHDSTAQSSIWHCLKMLADFTAIKAKIDGFDGEHILAGEKEFHRFMRALYEDMYIHPDRYLIPTAEYDDYIKTLDMAEYYASEHKKSDAKEGRLRQAFQQAITFYPDYFYQLGLAATGLCKENAALIVPKPEYEKVLNAFGHPQGRIAVLEGMGLMIQDMGEAYHISCKSAPDMFLGLWVLAKAPESSHKYMNYLRLDYGPGPGLKNIIMTLEKDHAAVLSRLIAFFEAPRVRIKLHPLKSITSNHKWKVEYSLSGKRVFEFYAGPDYLVTHLFFRDTQILTKVIELIENDDRELFEWLKDRFKERKGCAAKCPRNKAVMFGDQEKRVCGSTNQVEIMNPDEDDIKKSIALIRVLNGVA